MSNELHLIHGLYHQKCPVVFYLIYRRPLCYPKWHEMPLVRQKNVFSVIRIKDNRYKLEHEFSLNLKEKHLYFEDNGTLEQPLPMQVVESSAETFKPHLNTFLCNHILVYLH